MTPMSDAQLLLIMGGAAAIAFVASVVPWYRTSEWFRANIHRWPSACHWVGTIIGIIGAAFVAFQYPVPAYMFCWCRLMFALGSMPICCIWDGAPIIQDRPAVGSIICGDCRSANCW